MPYAPGFVRALYARANGRTLNNKNLDKISPEKAKELLAEAKGKALKGGK